MRGRLLAAITVTLLLVAAAGAGGAAFPDRIDARTGAREIAVPAAARRAAIGLKVDRHERLFVAGGATGKAFVYDASDLSGARELALQGFDQQPGFNLNGIVASADGRTLLAVQSNTGRLWRIDPATGASEPVDLGGASLANGDGLLLHRRTLYVVQNRSNQIAVVRLDRGYESGEVVRTITSGDFDVPTTIARFGSSLYAVNARFGTPPTPDTDYWITRVRR